VRAGQRPAEQRARGVVRSSVANDPARRGRGGTIRPEVWQAYLDAPEHTVAEILGGDLVLSPRPRLRHGNVSEIVHGELYGPFRRGRGGPGGWVFQLEPELHLSEIDKPVVPDLAGWRRERLPPDFLQDAAATVAPDWVCEVLSDRTRGIDRVTKMGIYQDAGVTYVWLIDPEAQTLECFRRDAPRWTLVLSARDDARVRAEPFDAIELDLALLWTL
jgi:Uma2 family endonuclease